MAKYMKSGSAVTRALGEMVGLALALYVFSEIIGSVMGYINVSGATFETAALFMQNLFPIMGILGAFEIVYRALRKSGLM